MTTHFTALAKAAAADGKVSSEEVLALRQQGWGDGIIVREEAEALFALNNALDEREQEWCDFFVEAIGEYVLNGTEPKRQCSEAEARWLIAQIDHDGVMESFVELETLVRIIERAENVPSLLKDYVIEQVEKEVLTGTGPTRCGGELSDAHITEAEAKILRRVIFASGGYGPAAVSRFEAEMLFRLKDATLAEANAAEWDEVFLDGVSNYLKGFALQNAQLEHGRAKELEAFVADNQANVGRFFGRMVREVPQAANHFGKVFGKKQPSAPSYEEQAAAGEAITDHEQQWLDAMIEADGEVDDLERRLLARIIEEG
ncbi:hypothetical protein INR77_01415 [Erythrobacter sp. SCSIO 43205]|uniref:hypothetical protein n=1 Tax=Erythrobacter sp. SCSIO 43205 TaxID=2779361 RepID=UPI001CA8B4C2|nr:hypothetical protein [Erythrobacter sp. SCSIO 43205]UAB78431.1 hypothetical protein INR77_01415 [Erythrobacter sp. SCSIO 43205]